MKGQLDLQKPVHPQSRKINSWYQGFLFRIMDCEILRDDLNILCIWYLHMLSKSHLLVSYGLTPEVQFFSTDTTC